MTPHLDDEQLSALIDGEATAGEAAHSSVCPTCRARLERLREAASAVAVAPERPSPIVRERALAAARRAAAPASAGAPSANGAGADRGMRRVGPRPAPAWLLGAAAAVVAILIAVPLLAGGFGGGGAKKAASTASKAAEAPDRRPLSNEPSGATDAAGGIANVSAAPQAPADLGAISNRDDLARAISASRQFASARPPAAAVPGSTTTTEAGSTATRRATSATTAAAAPEAAGTATGAPAGCTAEAAAAAASAGAGPAASFVVTLRWQGRAATATGFPANGGQVLVIVTAADDCTVLVTTKL